MIEYYSRLQITDVIILKLLDEHYSWYSYWQLIGVDFAVGQINIDLIPKTDGDGKRQA